MKMVRKIRTNLLLTHSFPLDNPNCQSNYSFFKMGLKLSLPYRGSDGVNLRQFVAVFAPYETIGQKSVFRRY